MIFDRKRKIQRILFPNTNELNKMQIFIEEYINWIILIYD